MKKLILALISALMIFATEASGSLFTRIFTATNSICKDSSQRHWKIFTEILLVQKRRGSDIITKRRD